MKRDTVIPILAKIETFINRFATFSDEQYSLPIALWILGTFLYPDFDAFPYMVITSDTKRSGKTRLAELISFCCSNPRMFGAMTPSTLFRSMDEEQPTIMFDEAEVLSSEAASAMRAVLNMGYRKGQTVPRTVGGQIHEFKTYCPKVFILIGDVYDTLKDRSIVIRMKRSEPKERFTYEMVKAEGANLRAEIAALVAEHRSEFIQTFVEFKGIEFLTDRDEEIWTPLFVMAQSGGVKLLDRLSRCAVDMATEKTAPSRKYINLMDAEEKTQDDDYAKQLVRDMLQLINGGKCIASADAVNQLREMPLAPWRKFKGDGITMHNIADILSRFGVQPTYVLLGHGRKNSKSARGYKRVDLEKALQSCK